jgi:hypothetical protein
VGAAADKFVELLESEVQALWPGALCCDFRSSTDADGGQGKRDFKAFVDFDARPERPAFLVTIDRFGEGVSIPSIDAIVMLRATLSLRVAIQSLGRGLRLSNGKSDCLVLDAVQFWESLNRHERLPEACAPGFPRRRSRVHTRQPSTNAEHALRISDWAPLEHSSASGEHMRAHLRRSENSYPYLFRLPSYYTQAVGCVGAMIGNGNLSNGLIEMTCVGHLVYLSDVGQGGSVVELVRWHDEVVSVGRELPDGFEHLLRTAPFEFARAVVHWLNRRSDDTMGCQ